MLKKTATIIAAFIAVITLASCGNGQVIYDRAEHARPAATGQSWTVLVYMCGGNEETAHGAASAKLESIMSVDYPENVNVVVQTGGSAKWNTKGVYNDYNQRFEAGYGTLYLADQAMSANMGDYRTLTDFLSWGVSNYKSDNYMLILSGAGGGSMDGMISDENFDGDSLNLEEISYAMSLAGQHFDIVCLDASLMGGIETAAALSTCSKYLVAPQSIQDSDTFDYAGVLQYVCDNPSSDTADICKAVCDLYYAGSEANGTAAETAMSVVDMSKVSTLNQAFDGMAGEMLVSTNQMSDYINMTNAVSSAHMYGGATEDEGYSNLIDLGDTAMKIHDYVRNTADAVVDALNDAVVYRVCGANQHDSTGLNMYYPISPDNDELQMYMDNGVSVNYKEFLRKICPSCSVEDTLSNTADYTSSWAWTSYNVAMEQLQYMTVLDANSYGLNVTGDMSVLKDVAVNVYKADDKSGEYVFLASHKDLEQNWEGGVFKDVFSRKLPRLISKCVTIRLVKDHGDYAVYSVPVILNGEKSCIRVRRDAQSGDYDIIGAWSGTDENGKVTSSLHPLGAFDRIAPLLAVYDEEHKKNDYATDPAGMKLRAGVSESNVPNGDYLFEFEITDIYGQKRHGTPVRAHISGENIMYE